MEVRMESKNEAPLAGMDPVLVEIQRRLQARPKEWLKALRRDPGKFADLEKEVHRQFTQRADQVVAGLLAQATAGAAFTDAAKQK